MASSSKEASASPQNPTPSSDETPSSNPFNFNLGSDSPTVPSRSARSRPRLVKHRKQQARSRTETPSSNPFNFNLGSDGPTVPSLSARSRPRLVKHRKQQAPELNPFRSRTGPAPELNPFRSVAAAASNQFTSSSGAEFSGTGGVNSGDFNELESMVKLMQI